MLNLGLLILAALLEVSGDALIRSGLKTGGIFFMIGGIVVLAGYGLMVNLTKLDFGHLMGLYIVLFFIVSQIVAVVVFKERLPLGMYVGGSLVILGGVVSVWPR